MTRFRFWLYRNILALFTLLAFRRQRVYPLTEPVDGEVQFRPYAELHPDMPVTGWYLPTTFPRSDRAAARLRRVRLEKWLIRFVRVIAPTRTPPVPTGQAGFMRPLSEVSPQGVARVTDTACRAGGHGRCHRRACDPRSVRERA
jgi:hypothetical protein